MCIRDHLCHEVADEGLRIFTYSRIPRIACKAATNELLITPQQPGEHINGKGTPFATEFPLEPPTDARLIR